MPEKLKQQFPEQERLVQSGLVSSLDEAARTVDVVFLSGTDVGRMNPYTGEPYILRFDPQGADLSRLNTGAPVLDNHDSSSSVDAVKGVVEKAWRDGKAFMARLRFADTPDVESLWQKVKQRIITKVSMGVNITSSKNTVEKGPDGTQQQLRLITAWQPYELSMVPVPADPGTTTLSAASQQAGPGGDGNSTRADEAPLTKEESMNEQMNQPVAAPPAVPSAPAGPSAEQLAQQAAATERNRILQIEKLGADVKIPARLIAKHKEAGTSFEDFRRIVADIEELRSAETTIPTQQSARTEVMRDETDTRRELMSAQVGQLMTGKHDANDANYFRGMSIKRIAEESIRRQYNLRHLPTAHELVTLSMQNTADFANVLENSARKALLTRYGLATPTYRIWTKASTTPDFKTISRSRLSTAPTFQTVSEGAQITIAPMSDSKETYALATLGRGVSFTRQMLINDDLNAFVDLLNMFGDQAARAENKAVYAILYANANMSDSVALFHASHGNSGTGALTAGSTANTSLDSMFTAMAVQKDLDGVSVLNIVPKFLIVPAAKKMTAEQALLPTNQGVKAADQSIFSGRLTVVADAELDGNGSGTAKWYGAADPNIYPGIEYCHLDGAEGPQVIRQENTNGILGVQLFAFIDFAAKAVDYRPLYYSTGS